eukprot:1144895-Pelagomonas_calceolata.AAC.2
MNIIPRLKLADFLQGKAGGAGKGKGCNFCPLLCGAAVREQHPRLKHAGHLRMCVCVCSTEQPTLVAHCHAFMSSTPPLCRCVVWQSCMAAVAPLCHRLIWQQSLELLIPASLAMSCKSFCAWTAHPTFTLGLSMQHPLGACVHGQAWWPFECAQMSGEAVGNPVDGWDCSHGHWLRE